MKRTKESSGIKLYYDALQDIFNKQSNVLTGVLTHYGERGRNDEKYLLKFLQRVLPHRFSIGSGFIVSSDNSKKISRQTDIIISDQFWNSPLYRELAAEVYPIETVYAIIEVKGLLDKSVKGRKEKKSDLDKCLEDIAFIRDLASCKKYLRYISRSKNGNQDDKPIVSKEEYSIHLPPRSYVFAYAKKGWRTLADFKSYLKDSLQKHSSAHLHGIVILEKNWFAFQEPYSGNDVEIHAFKDNALLRFTNTLLRGIQSMPMDIASIDDYHRLGLYDGFLSGDPSYSGYIGDTEPPDASQDIENSLINN
jgi:hypothetical protein